MISIIYDKLLCFFQYRTDFPGDVRERAVFVDMAPNFSQMAEDILQKQVQLVNVSLKEV